MADAPAVGDAVFLQLRTASGDKVCVCGILAAASSDTLAAKIVLPGDAAALLGRGEVTSLLAARGEGAVDVVAVTVPQRALMSSRPPQWTSNDVESAERFGLGRIG